MTDTITIRPECDADHPTIREVIASAFHGMSYADGDEFELVDALRTKGALAASLVAEINGLIVGQVAFSPAKLHSGKGGWYALGPLAVLPDYQRRGIGSKLILAGLQAIRSLGADGCMLVGSPKYYSRFGFSVSPLNAPEGHPKQYFMILKFGLESPIGPIHFDPAFGAA